MKVSITNSKGRVVTGTLEQELKRGQPFQLKLDGSFESAQYREIEELTETKTAFYALCAGEYFSGKVKGQFLLFITFTFTLTSTKTKTITNTYTLN